MAKSNKSKGHSVHHKDESKAQSTKHKAQKDEKDLEDATVQAQNEKDVQKTKSKKSAIDIELDCETADKEEKSQKTSTEAETERNKYLRLAAEYDNFRKRSKTERETAYRDARIEAITRFLPVYDNLERALKMECSDEAFYKGIEMTMTSLKEILENMGVVTISAVGEAFDPNRHNAVMTIENPQLGEKIVAEEFQKGFMLGDKVIRFSTVVVAN